MNYLIPRSLLRLPERLTSRMTRFPSIFDELEDQLNELALSENTGLSIFEDKDNVYVEAALPGLQQNEIQVDLNRGRLWIKGEKKEETEDKEKKFYRRAQRSFAYNVDLPANIDDNKEPKAIFENGILKITFQKEKTSQGKKIQIESKRK